VGIPEPFAGAGSGLTYFYSAQIKEGATGAKNAPDHAEDKAPIDYNLLKPDELLAHYLRYVVAHLDDNGLYRKTDKEVQTDMNLSSDDKAQRIKKRAIEKGFLVPQLEKKQVLSPQRAKINRYLNTIQS
jgi:hypothetical protein